MLSMLLLIVRAVIRDVALICSSLLNSFMRDVHPGHFDRCQTCPQTALCMYSARASHDPAKRSCIVPPQTTQDVVVGIWAWTWTEDMREEVAYFPQRIGDRL